MAHASDRQPDRRSRTDLFKSFVRSRTPSPSKQRTKETIRDARPIQLPAMLSSGALMLPPDHPHANAVLGEIHNNRKSSPERGTSRPRRKDSSETKRTRPESIGAPAFRQPSPPKRRQYALETIDKENCDSIASGRPAPMWTQYTSQASLLDQGVVLKRKDSSTQTAPRASTDASTSQNPADTSKTVNGTITSQSTIGSITSTSSTGASSMARGASKLSLLDSRYDTLRNLDGPAFDAAFESVLVRQIFVTICAQANLVQSRSGTYLNRQGTIFELWTSRSKWSLSSMVQQKASYKTSKNLVNHLSGNSVSPSQAGADQLHAMTMRTLEMTANRRQRRVCREDVVELRLQSLPKKQDRHRRNHDHCPDHDP